MHIGLGIDSYSKYRYNINTQVSVSIITIRYMYCLNIQQQINRVMLVNDAVKIVNGRIKLPPRHWSWSNRKQRSPEVDIHCRIYTVYTLPYKATVLLSDCKEPHQIHGSYELPSSVPGYQLNWTIQNWFQYFIFAHFLP